MDRQRIGGVSRREFFRRAAAGGAAFALTPYLWTRHPAIGFAGGSEVHPNISSLRVVGIHDEKMTTALEPTATWTRQEQLVQADRVAYNLDRLACTLAQEKDAKKAWQAIFVKPPKKDWSDVVVAIKANHISKQRARSAVVAKVCRVLTDTIGVKGQNIHIYDAVTGKRMATKTPYKGLPEGVDLAGLWGGVTTPTRVPAPWKGGREQARCLKQLVEGKVDILVNLALCKGHGRQFGGFTMTMKNHFGTFDPRPSHRAGGGTDYLVAINKTTEILGPLDPKKGTVTFPRQQLCLIDALWASKPGPGGEATHQPNSLYMGVMSPVVDYQVATHLRHKRLGWYVEKKVLRRFCEEFGFTPEALPEGGKIIEPVG